MSRLEDIARVAILKNFPINTKTTKSYKNPTNNSNTTITILPFLPICKEIGHFVILIQFSQFVFLQNLVVRFCWELKQNKNLVIGENHQATYQRHPVYQKALSGPRAIVL